MPREINAKIDALFVEGDDDRAVVNALMKKMAGLDLTVDPYKVVKSNRDGGGDTWAVRQFKKRIEERRPEARIGLIVDRDHEANDKWPAVSTILRDLGVEPGGPDGAGAIVSGRYGVWMWPDNVSHGDLETFVNGIISAGADPRLRRRGMPDRQGRSRGRVRASPRAQGGAEGPQRVARRQRSRRLRPPRP